MSDGLNSVSCDGGVVARDDRPLVMVSFWIQAELQKQYLYLCFNVEMIKISFGCNGNVEVI